MNRLGVIVGDWAHVARRWPASLIDRTPPDAFVDGHLTPVVLLPGIWESWRYLMPLARRLHGFGHPVHPIPSLGWNGADLATSVDRVRAHLARHDLAGSVFVAHSKGGLIGKQLLMDPDVGPHLAGMVAMCSPFGGSRLAARVFQRTPLGLFAPTGATILALAAESAVNARIVSIGSAWDEMIPNGSWLEGARNVTAPMAGHFRPIANEGFSHLVHDHVERLAAG